MRLPTRVLSHENENRRYYQCNGYLVLFNVGKELNRVKVRHDDNNSAADERKKHELDSTWEGKKSKNLYFKNLTDFLPYIWKNGNIASSLSDVSMGGNTCLTIGSTEVKFLCVVC